MGGCCAGRANVPTAVSSEKKYEFFTFEAASV